MNLSVVLPVSAIYIALVGLGFLLAPDAMMSGTVGPDASAGLIANLRIPSSTFLGIALLNWMARNAEASKARDAIVLANTVGFGVAGVLGVLAVLTGAPAIELVLAVITLVIAGAFFWAGRASMSAGTA